MPKRNEAPSSFFIIHQASSTTSNLFLIFARMALQIWWIIKYVATGRKSSSISRTEKTTHFWLISTLVGWLINPDQVPLVNFRRRWAKLSPPSILAKTSSKSESIGGVALLKFESGVMSREA